MSTKENGMINTNNDGQHQSQHMSEHDMIGKEDSMRTAPQIERVTGQAGVLAASSRTAKQNSNRVLHQLRRWLGGLALVLLATTAQAGLNGYHDVGDCTSISGWAWDDTQATTPISVDLYDGATLLTTVTAGNFRQDLLNAGIGDGNHGFQISTPSALIDGKSHTVTAKYAGTQTSLNNTPKTLSCVAPGVPTPAYDGYLDVGNCTHIAGWAWDSNQANTSISIDLYDGATLLTTVTASNFRVDLLNAGKGNGIHGFDLPLPASLINNQPHTITAKYAGTQTSLNASPKTMSCIAPGVATPAYEGYLDIGNCTHIAGWAWDSNQPNTPISIDLYDGATLLTTVTASNFRVDLANAGKGNGSHGFDLPLPTSLINNQPHTITAKYAGTQTSLNSSPKTMSCIAPGVATPAYNGYHDVANCTTIAGWAWDSNTPTTPISVDVYDGSTLLTTVAAGTFRQDLLNAGIGDGNHGFTLATPASLKDGIAHSISIKYAGTQTILNTSPKPLSCVAATTVSLTSPAPNAVSTAPGSFTLTAGTTGSVAKVDFYAASTNAGTVTNTLIGTVPTTTNGVYSFAWSNVAAGTYSLTAVATDTQNISTTSAAVSVTSDQAPTVTLTSPAAGTQITSPNSFTLSATASSTTSTVSKVDFYANNGTSNTLVGTATTATAGAYNVTWSNVPVGSYSLTAIATDALGTTTTTVATSVTAIANVPPTISLTGPVNGTTVRVPGSFTLTATASSTTSAIAKVDFYASNGTTNTMVGTATTAPYSFAWSNVALGSYSITAQATDTLNATTTSTAVTVTVNTGIAQAYYIHTDHLDTARLITDTSGNVVWEWQNSDPFGNSPPNENPAGLGTFKFDLRFPGMVSDVETGLFQNHFRDYDPATGRYPESDPLGLYGGSFSTFVYAGGNPLIFIDPLGLCWIYSQSTGKLFYQPPDDAGGGPPAPIGTGYSGITRVVNMGALEMARNVGPIPVGSYSIGPQQDIETHNADGTVHSTLLGAMRLTPDPGQYIWGRDGFIIHGSNDYENKTGSNGCPIFRRNIRDKIGASDDKCFRVVE